MGGILPGEMTDVDQVELAVGQALVEYRWLLGGTAQSHKRGGASGPLVAHLRVPGRPPGPALGFDLIDGLV